jgi:hypothetical protein
MATDRVAQTSARPLRGALRAPSTGLSTAVTVYNGLASCLRARVAALGWAGGTGSVRAAAR